MQASDALSNPTIQQYRPTISAPAAHPHMGTLPFTGFDVTAIVLVALALVLAGAFLRRMSDVSG